MLLFLATFYSVCPVASCVYGCDRLPVPPWGASATLSAYLLSRVSLTGRYFWKQSQSQPHLVNTVIGFWQKDTIDEGCRRVKC
ncbi:hypothetical protein BDV29DRAFT_181556, partial [Aspergillus leporis]